MENLDKAIDEGWIEVYFQPIIRAANDKVCEEECLARWNDPENGFLSPSDFIPILEEKSIIYKLDLHIVDKVLEKLKDQAANGLFIVPQTINLSKEDFYACDMVEEIRKKVDASGLGRQYLIIEISEDSISSDIEFMKKHVEVQDHPDMFFHREQPERVLIDLRYLIDTGDWAKTPDNIEANNEGYNLVKRVLGLPEYKGE